MNVLQIRFRNTDGYIYKTFEESNNINNGDEYYYDNKFNDYELQPSLLGHTVFLDNRIIITDRQPKQEFTQLTVNHMIRIIRYALKYYDRRFDKIHIYLPQLDSSMNKQATYQYQFQHLIENEDENSIIYDNDKYEIDIIHV